MPGSKTSARLMPRLAILVVVFTTISAFFAPSCGASRYPPGMVCKEKPAKVSPLESNEFDDGLTEDARRSLIAKVIDTTVAITAARATEDGTKNFIGTGVAIDDRGTILTANHVTVGATRVTVSRRQVAADGLTVFRGPDVEMTIVAQDAASDVAILRPIDDDDLEDLPPAIDIAVGWQPMNGEQLWQFGRTSKWTRGIVSDAAARITRRPGDVELGFTVRPGDSGGPVVRVDGTLVGIVLARIEGDETTTTDDRGYFMPVSIGLAALHYEPRP